MPTQTEIEFRATRGGQSQNTLLREIFLAEPNIWHPAPELGRRIRSGVPHSRVADLRKKHGMTIENRQHVDPMTGLRHSFYRYVPA